MTPEALRAAVAELRWFHRMDLGHGVVTPGVVDCARQLPLLQLPQRLDGLSVLDIGAWDGFYAFECERRGAARVLATDSYCWSGSGWGDKRAFELARRALGSRVEDLDIDALALAPERVGRSTSCSSSASSITCRTRFSGWSAPPASPPDG